MPRFRDRRDAGQALADHLAPRTNTEGLLVLGIPRGGVPVAAEVANTLGVPLDVFVARKLGVPGHEELAFGAVALGGVRVLNRELIHQLGLSDAVIERITAAEQQEMARRITAYRGNRPLPNLRGATVILVDDGAATGASMVAAVEGIRAHAPRWVIAAAPVMSREAVARLESVADECVTVEVPEPFGAVGAFYHDFHQTTDAEVRALLFQDVQHRDARGSPSAGHAPR